MSAGNSIVYYMGSTTQTLSLTEATVGLDTTLQIDTDTYSVSGGVITIKEAGTYLVINHLAVDRVAGTNANRTSGESFLHINNTLVAGAYTDGYIRRNSGDDEFSDCAYGIYELAANDELEMRQLRINAVGSDARIVGNVTTYIDAKTSLTLIKLNADNAKIILEATAAQNQTLTADNTYVDMNWDDEITKDTGFTHSESTNPDEITLDAAGKYLAVYSNSWFRTVSSSTRTGAFEVLDLDGSIIPGSFKNNYIRGTQSSEQIMRGNNSAMVLFETTAANQKVKLKSAREAGAITLTRYPLKSRLVIYKLNGDEKTFRIESASTENIGSTTESTMTYDVSDWVDTGFSLASNQVTVTDGSKFLLMQGVQAISNVNARSGSYQFGRYNGVNNKYGTGAKYSRDTAGCDMICPHWASVQSISDTQKIECRMKSLNANTTGALRQANTGAFCGIDLATLESAAIEISGTAAAESTISGDLDITCNLSGTVAAASSTAGDIKYTVILSSTTGGSPELVDEYELSNRDSGWFMHNGASTERGQTFKLDNDTEITSVKFALYKDGSPTGNAYANIYAHTGTFGTATGLPTGAVLHTSEALDVSTLTGSYAFYEFTFDTPYEVEADTPFCIAVTYSGGDSSNKVYFGYDDSSPTHNGINFYYWISSWQENADRDSVFELYGISGSGGGVAVVSTVTGNLSVTSNNYLSGTIAAESTISGDLDITCNLSGTVAAASSTAGDIKYTVILSSTSGTDTKVDSRADTSASYQSWNPYIGQVFDSGIGGILVKAHFYLAKSADATGTTVRAVLFAAQGTGTYGTDLRPSGSILAASETIDISTLTTWSTFGGVDFEFTDEYELDADTYYGIMLDVTNRTAGTIYEGCDSDGSGHDGNRAYYVSPNWYANTARATSFEVWVGGGGGGVAVVSTVTGNLTVTVPAIELSGTIAADTGATGELLVTCPLKGAVAATTNITGVLGVSKPLKGTAAAASNISGSLAVIKALSGVINAASNVSGNLDHNNRLIGSVVSAAIISGDLAVAKNLSGEAAAITNITGVLSIIKKLLGTVDAASSVLGDIALSNNLSGTAAAVSVINGILAVSGNNYLSGTIASSSGADGSLHLVKSLKGSVVSISDTAASIKVTSVLTGSSDSLSSVSGALAVSKYLHGTIAAVSDTAANLVIAGSNILTGTVESVSSTAGALKQVLSLKGITAAQSAVSGVLIVSMSNLLSGTINANSGVEGGLTVLVELSGTSAAQSGTDGNLLVLASLSGTVSAAAATTGSLKIVISLSGAVNAAAAISAALKVAKNLSGNITAVSVVTGILSNGVRVWIIQVDGIFDTGKDMTGVYDTIKSENGIVEDIEETGIFDTGRTMVKIFDTKKEV